MSYWLFSGQNSSCLCSKLCVPSNFLYFLLISISTTWVRFLLFAIFGISVNWYPCIWRSFMKIENQSNQNHLDSLVIFHPDIYFDVLKNWWHIHTFLPHGWGGKENGPLLFMVTLTYHIGCCQYVWCQIIYKLNGTEYNQVRNRRFQRHTTYN